MGKDSERDRAGEALDRAALVFCLTSRERELLELLVDGLFDAAPQLRAVTVGDAVERTGCSIQEIAAALDSGGALTRWGLIAVGDGPWRARTLALDESFWPRLVGHWPRELPRALALDEGLLDRMVLDDATRARATEVAAWAGRMQRWPTVVVHGPAGSGRATLGCALAGAIGVPALVVAGSGVRAATVKVLAREAIWQQAALVVDDADAAEPAALDDLAAALLAPMIATSVTGAIHMPPSRPVAQVGVRALDHAARAALWERALRAEGIAENAVDVGRLASRFRLGPQRITAAVRSAAGAGGEGSTETLVEHCRGLPSGDLGGLGRRMELPYAWDDLIVPDNVRRELDLVVAWGRHAASVFGRGGAGARVHAAPGVGCLFHGPPGTGKTMAAQVIARELDRDLYRVDLSQVLDKYIGETEKRLDRVLRDAERADCVLLFDEADALFAQRTEVREARDRYANIETGFLLQRLEEHQGVCILASNLQGSIDSAFHRRLLVIAEFPLPSAVERTTIWDRQLPAPEERAGDIDVDFLAARFALSGGAIRNAVVVAVLLAAEDATAMTMRHLVVAGWREQAKAGRLVDARELGAWREVVTGLAGSGRRR